ncbi:DUF2586 domain-containing protein [Desulfosediminicola sp.]|uniref:DUF2586 domain-containing protein n=1 Tax=Desulfosediminicola sp. TaxID=2886825 RepID=UPI003AF2E35D
MLGKIQLNKLNLMQGPIAEIERHFLVIGTGSTNVGSILSVGPETDLDAALGVEKSVLKTQVEAMVLNAGQNFSCSVLPLADGSVWDAGVDFAMETINCEAIVLVEPIADSTDLEAMQAKTVAIMAEYMRPVFFIAAARAIDDTTETWDAYVTATAPLLQNVATPEVCCVPYLWPDDVGTLAGRLCNRSVTVADSPMRVATGALVGERSNKPLDLNGAAITTAQLKALDANRFSVPQWYPSFPGMYWGDCNMLDVPGGDYQVVENLRVVQKAMRQIYPLAVARIADRRLNSTPQSIAANKLYFMRPLRKMAKSAILLGEPFPGEIYPPTDSSIDIVWLDKTTVQIYLTVRPYNCPKDITVNLALDLSTE